MNGHAFPPGAIVYNLENVGLQVSADAFPDNQIWDFSDVGTRAWGGRTVHAPDQRVHRSSVWLRLPERRRQVPEIARPPSSRSARARARA